MDKKKRTKKSKYSNIIYKVTSKTFFGRLEVLGEMDWKPITRYGKVIPDYYLPEFLGYLAHYLVAILVAYCPFLINIYEILPYKL